MDILSLLKRGQKGSALTAAEFDENLTRVETKVNALINLFGLVMTDEGELKDGKVTTAAQVADRILTLAKLAKVNSSETGRILRVGAPDAGDEPRCAIELGGLASVHATDATQVVVNGPQSGVVLSTFSFPNVPAGTVFVMGTAYANAVSGTPEGTVWLKHGAAVVDAAPTHGAAVGGALWETLPFHGVIEGFAGGTLTLTFEAQSESECTIEFGVGGDGRLGRKVSLLAGL